MGLRGGGDVLWSLQVLRYLQLKLSTGQNDTFGGLGGQRGCPDPIQFLHLKLPWEFHILKVDLIDYFMSLIQHFTPDNRSVQLTSFQEPVIKMYFSKLAL